ncbi:hypothetical protein E4U55_006532 [Claviceps digitariae]|nr:hypothetical protein E4U55_006532 [Claviceps digitariae]
MKFLALTALVAAMPALANIDYTLTCNPRYYTGSLDGAQTFWNVLYSTVCVHDLGCGNWVMPEPSDENVWVGTCTNCRTGLSSIQKNGFCHMVPK